MHIFHHHELPRGVRLQHPAWWRQETIDQPLAHEETAHVKTPRAASAAPSTPAAALVEDEPTAKRRKVQVDPIVRDWFLDMLDQWKTERQQGIPRHLGEVQRLCPGLFDGINPNAPYRWKRSAQRAAPLGRKTLLSPADVTWLSEHIVWGDRRGLTIHGLVHELLDAEGHDVRPSKWWVRQLLRGMRSSNEKPAKCVKELHSPEQQHANTHRLFIKLCWLMNTHAVSANRVVNIDETPCRLLLGASDRVGPPRRQVSSAAGQHEGGHDTQGRLPNGPWPAGYAGADRSRGQDRRRLAGAALAGAHSPRHVRERLGNHDDALAAHDRVNPAGQGRTSVGPYLGRGQHPRQRGHPALSFTSCCASSCHDALRTCSPVTWPSSAVFKSRTQAQASATLARSVIDGSFEGLAMNKAWRRQ